jgi:hypothetical protein
MTIDPLSLDGLKAPEPRPHGAVGALQWLTVADLRVDRSYQRDIRAQGRRKIMQIAAEFDWSAFSPVICAAVEGGVYAIIDGQHRATAAMLIGIEKVPCLIVIADRARQAKSFASINGTITRMNSYSIYRAARAAGDETVLAIDALCASCGVRVLTGPRELSRLKPGDTLAVSALRIAYDRFGPAILRKALTAIMAPGDVSVGLIKPQVLNGLCLFFAAPAQRGMDPAKVRLLFADIDLAQALDRARTVSNSKPATALCEEIARRFGDRSHAA